MKPYGLTTLQYTTLSVLGRRGELSNAQLARRAYMTPQSMSEVHRRAREEGPDRAKPASEPPARLPGGTDREGRQVLGRVQRGGRRARARDARGPRAPHQERKPPERALSAPSGAARRLPARSYRRLSGSLMLPTEEEAMGVLDGKAAIVTGLGAWDRARGRELLAEHGARVLISDLDADVAQQAAAEIGGETAVFGGDLTRTAFPRRSSRGSRRVRTARHRRQQRRLHLGRNGAQDERRAVPRDARDPHRRPVQGAPRRGAVPREPGKADGKRAERSSARSSTSPRSRARRATSARSTTRRRRPGSSG